MDEQSKIAEAEHFYSEMVATVEERGWFEYSLSAFLTAARSVLQYAQKEATEKVGGQQWYDDRIGESTVLLFFKDERDLNIHDRPAKPSAHVEAKLQDGALLDDSAGAAGYDPHGNLLFKDEPAAIPKPRPKPADRWTDRSSVDTTYYFKDWSGDEDVLELARKCLDELKDFVADGIAKRFLTAS